jgi:NADPH2:quinone reductase
VDVSRLYRIPQEIGFEQAAGTFIAFGTAYGALKWRAQLEPGEVCLVLGGAGAVGLASISTAKAMGAIVIGAGSSLERCALMSKHGADFTIDYSQEAIRDKVLNLTESKGANVIVDPVGGDVGSQALRCIAWSGRLVTLGFPSGKIPQYPASILLVKNIAVQGMYFGSYVAKRPDLVRDAMAFVWRGFLEESIRSVGVSSGKLEDVPELLTKLQERRQLGKAVVMP